MKKLLSLLGSVAIIGGASATIVACGSKPKETPKENPIEAAKKKLTSLIEEAEGLVNTSKKEANVTEALETAISNAQEILVKEGITEVELTNEASNLQKAIDEFNQAKDKEPVVIAKEALEAKIKEAEGLVNTSKKEANVTEALQKAIDEATEVLKDKKANEASFKGATTKLTQAIGEFNQAKDLDKQLQEKINQTKQNKTELENKNNQNGWESISEKGQTDFDLAIKEAELVAKKDKLTKEEMTWQCQKLDDAVENFSLALPQTIVSQAINLKKDDIKDLVFKDWSYDAFFDAKGQENDGNARLVNLLINDVKKLAKEHHYTEAEQTKLGELIVKHFAEKVKLVYLNEQDGQQKIKKVIDKGDGKMGLEKIFLDHVQQEFPDADLTNPEFWETHSKLSLGISFETKNLNLNTKEFWAFSLVNDISKEDSDEVQRLFKEAETQDGGHIIINIRAGLSKPDGSFTTVLTQALQKKVFHGKRFLGKLNSAWTNLPNDKQAEEGIIGWKSTKDASLVIRESWSSTILFKITTNYIINIIK